MTAKSKTSKTREAPIGKRYKTMCSMLAARNCYNSGLPVAQIARQAGRSTSTIRKWLKDCK